MLYDQQQLIIKLADGGIKVPKTVKTISEQYFFTPVIDSKFITENFAEPEKSKFYLILGAI